MLVRILHCHGQFPSPVVKNPRRHTPDRIIKDASHISPSVPQQSESNLTLAPRVRHFYAKRVFWPSGLQRKLHTSTLSENVNTAFKKCPDDRNALPVFTA